MKTAKLKDEKEVLDRQHNADIEAQKNLEENIQQLENRKQELELQEKNMQTKLKKILDTVGKYKEDLTRVRKDQREMKDKLVDSRLGQYWFAYPSIASLYFKMHLFGCTFVPGENMIC